MTDRLACGAISLLLVGVIALVCMVQPRHRAPEVGGEVRRHDPEQRTSTSGSGPEGGSLQTAEQREPLVSRHSGTVPERPETLGKERLTSGEAIVVKEGIRRSVEKARTRIDRHFDRMTRSPVDAFVEEQEYVQAKLFFQHELMLAFMASFEGGGYQLIASGDIPTEQPGKKYLNVGCVHGGEPATARIEVDSGADWIVHAERLLGERRLRWLVAIADRFNSMTLEERKQWVHRRREDPRWAAENFPNEVTVDEVRWLAKV